MKDFKIGKPFTVPPPGGGGGKNILVFKTNLFNTDHISKVMPSLNHHPNIIEWNVDLHDCDKILRVITNDFPAGEIEKLILHAGYSCEELK